MKDAIRSIVPARSRGAERAFTLVEMLVVIGIIAILAGVLLPMGMVAMKKAEKAANRATLNAIATGLDAYKDAWGSYPPVDAQNTGAAVLGKALMGLGDAANWSSSSTKTLQNATFAGQPLAFSPNPSYEAGSVVYSPAATPPTFGDYSKMYVSLQPVPVAYPAPAHNAPETDPTYWAPFWPFDGADGPGFRVRMNEDTDGDGIPDRASGQVYGPYLQADKFKTNGLDILDRDGRPILYFPANRSAKPSANLTISATPVPGFVSAGYKQSMYDANDNLMVFGGGTTGYAKIKMMLGDYGVNGLLDTQAGISEESAATSLPYLLWAAGQDKVFGPDTSSQGDFAINSDPSGITTAKIEQNRRAVNTCDDVTNFR